LLLDGHTLQEVATALLVQLARIRLKFALLLKLVVPEGRIVVRALLEVLLLY